MAILSQSPSFRFSSIPVSQPANINTLPKSKCKSFRCRAVSTFYTLPKSKCKSFQCRSVSTFSSVSHLALEKPGSSRGFGIQTRRLIPRFTRAFAASDALQHKDDSKNEQVEEEEEEDEFEGSTFPPQLKYLTEPAEEVIDYRPWILAGLAFSVVFRKAIWYFLDTTVLPLVRFACRYLMRSAQLSLYVFVKRSAPLLATMGTGSAWILLIVQSIYAYIVDMVPSRAIAEAFVLACIVLGIGEATNPNAVNDQPRTLTVAALFGLGGLVGLYGPFIFVLLLTFLTLFSLLVMKRDILSGVMPAAAVLTAVADPGVRIGSMLLFLSLAIYYNWKFPQQTKMEQRIGESSGLKIMRFLSILAGISAAAKWLYFRHLIWLSK